MLTKTQCLEIMYKILKKKKLKNITIFVLNYTKTPTNKQQQKNKKKLKTKKFQKFLF